MSLYWLVPAPEPFQYLYLIPPSFVQELERKHVFFSFYLFVAGVRNIYKPYYSFSESDHPGRCHLAVRTKLLKALKRKKKLLVCLAVQHLNC